MHPKKPRRRPRRRRLKPNIPTSLDDINDFASHLDELSCVLDMLKTIMAATKDIVQEVEVCFIHTDINNICEETDNGMNNTPLLFNREGVISMLHQRWPEYWGCRHDSRKKSCRSLNPSLSSRHSKAVYKLTTCECILMISWMRRIWRLFFERILFDIRDSLTANHCVADYDAINRRLDKCVFDFEVT